MMLRAITQSTLFAVVAVGLAGSRCAGQSIPAFSGADGAGAYISGGRGGQVYHVTKLDQNYNDNIPGTLRYGLTDGNFTVGGQVQPRTIVFDVAGTFWLGRLGAESGHDNGWDTQSRLNLGSHVTIAGQTAPGPVNIMGGVVKANGTNVVIRNVTIAPGYGMRTFSKPEDGEFPVSGDFPDSYVYDAIDISGTNVMIDHVTTAYATDETISANEAAGNVTIQYSNISQGQNYPQADAEASGVTYTGHALGSLLQGGSNAKFSVHHNLYAHQKGRLPRVGSEEGTGAYNDFRNNVFYNWFGTAGSGAGGQPSFNNFVGNFWLAGPGGDDPVGGASTAITTRNGGTGIFSGANASGTRVHHSGNLKDVNKDGDAADGVSLTNGDFGSSSFQANPLWHAGTPTYTGVTEPASIARDRVLDYMGANWWTRDEVVNTLDERLIHEVRTGTGKIRAWADDPFDNDPNEGGEWRSLLALRADPATGAAPFVREAGWDVDGDGLPAAWEIAHGLSDSAADNNGDFDADGYTNLEEYVNELAEWPAPAAIVFTGAASSRYAQIVNWDVNSDPALVGYWQPSRFDMVVIASGVAVVDAAGQHAGSVAIAWKPGETAALHVTDGWLRAANEVAVGGGGAGTVEHTGGTVVAASVVIGGGAASAANYRLAEGGWLQTGLLSLASGGAFDFEGGTLSAEVVDFDLTNDGGVMAPGDGVGRTHVQGDFTINAGELAIEIGGTEAGEFDRLVVDETLAAGGLLRVEVMESFTPGAGDAFDVLDFNQVNSAFMLDLPALAPGLEWNSDDLLSTGELRVEAVPIANADADGDGDVDGGDLLVWQRGVGLTGQTDRSNGDLNGDGTVDGADLTAWQAGFGASPFGDVAGVSEPAASVVIFIAVLKVGVAASGRARLLPSRVALQGSWLGGSLALP
jgi:hypothetical protein